jgi:hypothetical protein
VPSALESPQRRIGRLPRDSKDCFQRITRGFLAVSSGVRRCLGGWSADSGAGLRTAARNGWRIVSGTQQNPQPSVSNEILGAFTALHAVKCTRASSPAPSLGRLPCHTRQNPHGPFFVATRGAFPRPTDAGRSPIPSTHAAFGAPSTQNREEPTRETRGIWVTGRYFRSP